MECFRTLPTGILTNPGVVILLLINGHSRLLPRVLTLALASTMIALLHSSVPSLLILLHPCSPSLSLSLSVFLFPFFFLYLSSILFGFFCSYVFCETPPSSDLSVIRQSTQIKVSSQPTYLGASH